MIAAADRQTVAPIVRTFYDPLEELQDHRLLDLWKANWRYYGWQVEVVDLEDARAADPERYAKWERAEALYMPGTPRDYPFRCYARWLTMLGGGMMVDFDVFNYGLTPRMVEDIVNAAPRDKVIHFSGDATPCAEYGTSAAFQKYCQVFDDFIEAPNPTTDYLRQHVHDLNILGANRHAWQPIKLCSLYPREDLWDRYPLTHFTHGQVKYPRSTRIVKIRQFKRADQELTAFSLWNGTLANRSWRQWF